MAINSSTLAWKIPWTEEPGRLQSTGAAKSQTQFHFHFHFHAINWRRKLQPHQYSCLESSMEGGAWRATVHGVTKSWTRLND